MTINDIYGNDYDLKPYHVHVMLGVGWACFLGSWLINIAYYKFHPSSVDVFSKEIFSQKRFLYLFGWNVFEKNLFENGRKKQEGGLQGAQTQMYLLLCFELTFQCRL